MRSSDSLTDSRGQSAEDTRRRLFTKSRILLLAAHPDDETVGASTLLAENPTACVVFMTDGAPHDRKLWSSGLLCTREEYADIRKKEAYKALSVAGIPPSNLCFLEAVDQEAINQAGALVGKLREIFRNYKPEMVITHPFEGGHPDHDTASLVTTLALRQAGCAAQVMEMTSYHARDGQFVAGEFLANAESAEVSVELSEEERERKQRMMDCYWSQENVLRGFSTEKEKFRQTPTYNFTQPPHPGKLWYECMGWPMTGQRWRTLAAERLAGAGIVCG